MITHSAKYIFLDIRNFLAGRFEGATRDEFLLDELIKLIFCKYELFREDTSKLDILSLANLYRNTFRKVLFLYKDIYKDETCEIALDPVCINYIDRKLNSIDLFNLERDIIGDAYEIFMGDAIKGQSGQFFTPQNAAKALVKMVAPDPTNRIIDPACGTGGFLIATMKYWIAENERIADHHLDDRNRDDYYLDDLNPFHRHLYARNLFNLNLFGIDKDEYLTRLAKIHLACMGQPTNTITCSDSLVWDENILGERDFQYDVVLTNPPFGTNIQTGTNETLSKFELGYKYKTRSGTAIRTNDVNTSAPPQVIFMEQCIKLVRPGGKIGIVVPESMISNKKYSYVTDYILKTCRIRAVVGMPDELFKTSGKGGTHTKTCLLVLEKNGNNQDQIDYEIFMAEAKWCGHDSRGREIPKDDIPDILDTFSKFIHNEKFKNSNLGFVVKRSQIINNVLAPRAYVFEIQENEKFCKSHIFVSIEQLINENVLEVSTGNEVGKLAYGTGKIPFVRTSDISNWEIKSDPKHLLSDEIYHNLAPKQDVREGDILMVKDGSYLIGTCAMVTKYDTKIVYQSHLYKIRVSEQNKYNLDNYYLLAALSSEYVRKQIITKTFSQDIINSLGDRLKELIIPIAIDPHQILRISYAVKCSINSRAEARELAKQVRNEIFTFNGRMSASFDL